MSQSALERIQQLQQKHLAELESVRREAISELVAKIAEAKRTLAELSEQYIQLTGKTLTGERVEPAEQTAAAGRVRLTREQKAALPGKIAGVIGTGSLSFGDIASRLPGVPPSAIRSALKDKKQFRMEGTKGTARYQVK